MSTATSIQWTDKTWNPVAGCKKVSPGCANCYAETMAKRLKAMGQRDYQAVVNEHGWTGKFVELPHRLADPLKWRKPCRVFVNSMSDLFGEGISFEYVAAVYGVMAACPQHTFQVLTKRPERAREFFAWLETAQVSEPFEHAGIKYNVCRELSVCSMQLEAIAENEAERNTVGSIYEMACVVVALNKPQWPLPNVWLGVSVENQETADARIPLLLQCPAAIRFVSYEPALGLVDFSKVPGLNKAGSNGREIANRFWVIVGGESGPGARPFDIAWARSVIAQCKAASVACFVKQLGSNPIPSARPYGGGGRILSDSNGAHLIKDRKGGDMAEWPEDLRVREMPEVSP